MTTSRRTRWTQGWLRRARPVAAVAVLVAVVARIGPQPFVDGLREVDPTTLLGALLIAAVTTAACAWRWRRVAATLDVDVALAPAIAAYYRSQFLNSVLPGGVAGDVHRGIDHGRRTGSTGLSLRAVGWERAAGQGVQLAATALLLALLPSPLRRLGLVLVPLVLLAVVVVVALPRVRTGASRPGRWLAVASDDVRRGLRSPRDAAIVVALSLVVVAGHATTFLLAAHAAGATAPVGALVPVALLVLLAMSVPLHVAGWGLREGAAAWVFATAGLGAELGVRTAVVYGVVALVATLPGLVVLVVAAARDSLRPARVEVVLGG